VRLARRLRGLPKAETLRGLPKAETTQLGPSKLNSVLVEVDVVLGEPSNRTSFALDIVRRASQQAKLV
jgi:hypothetical protein